MRFRLWDFLEIYRSLGSRNSVQSRPLRTRGTRRDRRPLNASARDPRWPAVAGRVHDIARDEQGPEGIRRREVQHLKTEPEWRRTRGGRRQELLDSYSLDLSPFTPVWLVAKKPRVGRRMAR